MESTLVIVPTCNERANVAPLAREVLALDAAIEMLFVDDASPDGTGEVLEALVREAPRVHALHRPGNRGLGRAYAAGFRWARSGGRRRPREPHPASVAGGGAGDGP